MSLVRVREARRRDAEDLVELYTLVGWRLDVERAAGMIERSMRSSYSKVLVADLGGKVVGKATLDTVFQPYAEIVNVVVHPDYWGMGEARSSSGSASAGP